MEIKLLNDDFSVCKIRDLSGVNLTDSFYFIGKRMRNYHWCAERSMFRRRRRTERMAGRRFGSRECWIFP